MFLNYNKNIIYFLDVVYDKIDEENKIINLKALTNLEYASISGGNIIENMFIGLSLQQSWRVWEELRNTGKFYVVFEPRRFEDLLES